MRQGRLNLNKMLILGFAAIILLCLQIKGCANQAFYHGRRPERTNFTWQVKSTEHFKVMYKDRYFDPEPVLEELTTKFGIKPIISGIKIRLFIDDDSGYTIVGAKTIYASDERVLRHELAHILFLQLNRNAPRSLAEGIAKYAEVPGQFPTSSVDIEELIVAENDFRRVSKKSSGRRVYGMQANRIIERQLYSKGLCFVNSIINQKGIEAFKEFYKKCHSVENLQTAWNEVYGK